MKVLAALIALVPLPVLACDAPVCLVDPNQLNLLEVITFEDVPSGWDPGHRIDETLSLPGASFAERFVGQALGTKGDFDTVSGSAISPLTLLPGAPGETLSIIRLMDSNMLNGFGPAGFPSARAQGEGAIAVMFDDDQPAFSFQIIGGESGSATVQFLRRDGSVIHALDVDDLAKEELGFQRAGNEPDIAGFVITNTDPQGLAIDNLRFGLPRLSG